MVVVARDVGTTNVHVVFYYRNDEETWSWEKGSHFVLDYGSTTDPRRRHLIDEVENPALERVSVALSDKSALVGFPYSNYTDSVSDTGEVYVFERINGTEIWKKKDVTLQPVNDVIDGTSYYLNETLRYFYFGSSIDIVSDLACVISDYSPNGWGEPKVYVFRRVDSKWEQIRRLDLNYPPSAKECFVGDENSLAVQVNDYTVELFKYDEFDSNYKAIQSPIKDTLMESVSFDMEYLVYSTRKDYDCHETRGFYVYRREESHQPYILQQSVNITNSNACSYQTQRIPTHHDHERERSLFHIERTGFEASIYHDEDLLVVRGDNRTIVYEKRIDGYWEEALQLSGTYRGYRLSGQQLLATASNPSTGEDEIFYIDFEAYNRSTSEGKIFAVEDCEPYPTETPSLSQAPSSLTYPSPAPSIENTYGNTGVGGGIYHTQIPTESNLRCEDPRLNVAPSPSSESSLYSPTQPCYMLDITIAFDDNPTIMSWDVQKVDDNGGNEVVKTSRGVPDDAYQLRNESICLENGLYQFNIYGKGGIKYPGYYDVRSYGNLIARGGEFDCSETVAFAIPLTASQSAIPGSFLRV